MRNRFTRGLCMVAASAAITTSLGLAAAGAASASSKPQVTKNATTVCGSLCFDLSSALLGPNMIQNAPGGGPWLNLRQAGNARVNEDFEAGFVGHLGQFCANQTWLGNAGNGEIPSTSYACVNYPNFWDVFQANFAPDSNQSGQCVGVTVPGVSQRVSLVGCRGVTGPWQLLPVDQRRRPVHVPPAGADRQRQQQAPAQRAAGQPGEHQRRGGAGLPAVHHGNRPRFLRPVRD